MQEKSNVNRISISTGTMVRALLVFLGAYLVWYLKDFILVILTSIILASFVEAFVPYFKKIGIGRVTGIIIFYLIAGLLLAGLFYLFAPLLITEVYNFSTFLSGYIPGIDLLNYFKSEEFGGAKDIVANLSSHFSFGTLLSVSKAFIVNLSGGFFQTLSVAFGSIFNFLTIIVISFYLSVEEHGIANFLRLVLPLKYEDYAVDLWERSRRKIALWLKGQMMLALLVAVLIYLLLSLMGIQYALLLAIIAGIMEFIPYGVIVALIPAISFTYISSGFSTSVLVALVYIVIHQFEVFLFTPLIIKRVVGLSPLAVIISVLVGFELSGVWGLLISIPVAVCVVEFMNDIEKKKDFSRKSLE